MNQSQIKKLIPKLQYNLGRRRKLKCPDGPKGRHDKIRKVVTALFKHERLELQYNKADESRGYAERLISDAIRYGDCHKPTMEMASYWILEKQIIHKLFKVLAPRYQNYRSSYTKMWRAPTDREDGGLARCVLELRNNIYPPLGPDTSNHKNLLHNVLLQEAKKAYVIEKGLKAKSQEIALKQNLENLAVEHNSKLESSPVDANVISQAESSSEIEENKLHSTENDNSAGEINLSKNEDSTGVENTEPNATLNENLSNLKISENESKIEESKDKEK